MKLIVTYKSDVLGNGQFWTGDESEIASIKNFVAQDLARAVVKTGMPQSAGMWEVSPVKGE